MQDPQIVVCIDLSVHLFTGHHEITFTRQSTGPKTSSSLSRHLKDLAPVLDSYCDFISFFLSRSMTQVLVSSTPTTHPLPEMTVYLWCWVETEVIESDHLLGKEELEEVTYIYVYIYINIYLYSYWLTPSSSYWLRVYPSYSLRGYFSYSRYWSHCRYWRYWHYSR